MGHASETIAGFVAGLSFKNVDAKTLEALKRAATDCLACMLSSVNEPAARNLISHLARMKPPEATVVGNALKLPLEAAALANGVLAHATDFDDVSNSMWGHAAAPVLPAVLAIGEHFDLSGEDFLVAFLAGLEVETRLGAAIAPGHYLAGWHPTSTLGIFGATIGAARALKLDEQAIVMALGIAASRSSGLRANFGSMTKPLHVGLASRDGLEAALFARVGLTSRAEALDGTYSFLQVLGPGVTQIDSILKGLGRPFDIVETGLSFKIYPSCADTHTAVDTLLDLMEEHGLDGNDVRHIRVEVTQSVWDTLTYHRPHTGLEGKFSLEFCLARAARIGTLQLQDFRDDVVLSPDMQEFIGRVTVVVDDSLDDGTFCTPVVVEIETPKGLVGKKGTSARGHSGRPLDLGAIEKKFQDCAAGTLSPDRTRAALDALRRLEQLKSVRELIMTLVR